MEFNNGRGQLKAGERLRVRETGEADRRSHKGTKGEKEMDSGGTKEEAEVKRRC